MVNHEHKFIFIHIPKTAGISVGKALNKICDMGYNDDANLYSGFPIHHDELTIKMLKEYYVLTVVRNPWDRHYSQYKFRDWLQKKGPFSEVGFHYDKYYKEHYNHTPKQIYLFSTRTDRANQFGEFCHLPSQVQFLNGFYNDGLAKLGYVDKFIRFENLNEGFKEVCNDLGIKYEPLQHYNKSLETNEKFFPYKEAYTKELKKFVAYKYQDDIDYFNYEF